MPEGGLGRVRSLACEWLTSGTTGVAPKRQYLGRSFATLAHRGGDGNHVKAAWVAALAVGIAVGVALSVLALGASVAHPTHVVCVEGPVLGWSGPLASPETIGVAPPGGYVDYYVDVFNPGQTNYTGSFEEAPSPSNVTNADLQVFNWTLRSQATSTVSGSGPAVFCAKVVLVPTQNIPASDPSNRTMWPVLPSVAAGVGHRTVVPSQFNVGTIPSVSIDESYPLTPIGNFTWDIAKNDTEWSITPDPALIHMRDLRLEPWNWPPTGGFFGTEIALSIANFSFGVPIHLLNGTEETVPASFPANWIWNTTGHTVFAGELDYMIPMTTGEGTWEVYLAGGGDSLSPGGLLFEQLTWNNDSVNA